MAIGLGAECSVSDAMIFGHNGLPRSCAYLLALNKSLQTILSNDIHLERHPLQVGTRGQAQRFGELWSAFVVRAGPCASFQPTQCWVGTH
jgi:hypothetical protein